MKKSTQIILILGAGLVAFRMMRGRTQNEQGYNGGGIPMPPPQQDPLPSQLTKVYSIQGYDKACVYEYQYSVGNPPQYTTTFVIGDKSGTSFYYDSSQSNLMVNGKTATGFTYDNAVNQLNSMANPSTSPTSPQTPDPEYVPPTGPSRYRPDYGLGSTLGPLQGW
jgi:hypothetical protein